MSASSSSRAHLVVGTAGHIDHGKSRLVLALTGTDPDRWEEEKRRGITIDLGFADLELGGWHCAFVDVPGHERFVHNMLAGATGLDLVLLVVAADESVMPQTREHLAICRLLGIRSGVVALTRIDLAEPGLVELVEEEVSELTAGTFLENAPVVRVSAVTGEGLPELREALLETAARTPPPAAGPWPRLPVDRVFAARGFGTVVTGTLQGGALTTGQQLVAVPGASAGRVRGLQIHGETVERAEPHRRVAVNLQGLKAEQLERGLVLVPPGREVVTRVLDAQLEVIPEAACELEDGMRVRLHHGTAEVMARLRLPQPGRLGPGEEGAGQLRLENDLAVLPGDRFIVRRYSPITTLAGGRVADVDPPRWRRSDERWPQRTERLAGAGGRERLSLAAQEAGPEGLPLDRRAVRLGVAPEVARSWVDAGEMKTAAGPMFLLAGTRLVTREGLGALVDALAARLERFHAEQPLAPGMPAETLRSQGAPEWTGDEFRAALSHEAAERIVAERDAVRLADHRVELSAAREATLARLLEALDAAGLETRATAEVLAAVGAGRDGAELLDLAARRGEAVRVKEDLWLSARAWQTLLDRLAAEAAAGRDVLDVPTFKELFGLTRKFAIPILERLDDAGVTRRAGNQRVIRR
jgi:selenocysteine-specific elongation factor